MWPILLDFGSINSDNSYKPLISVCDIHVHIISRLLLTTIILIKAALSNPIFASSFLKSALTLLVLQNTAVFP